MNPLIEELRNGLPDAQGAARILVRLLAAVVFGAIIGVEREHVGKAAGLRTHLLVALGSAVFVLAPIEAGMASTDVSRIVQGLAAGIGFIGAGTILKLTDEREIRGLTTAASIWLTAGVGVAAGLGRFALGLVVASVGWVTLVLQERHPHRSA